MVDMMPPPYVTPAPTLHCREKAIDRDTVIVPQDWPGLRPVIAKTHQSSATVALTGIEHQNWQIPEKPGPEVIVPGQPPTRYPFKGPARHFP